MNVKKIKDKLYYYFAEKNWGVRREYGPYVDAHQEEHVKQPWKHWWLLIRLNWHYRVLRKDDYLIKQIKSYQTQDKIYPESLAYKRESTAKLLQRLMKYDVVSFDIFDTLIFRYLISPTDLFKIIGMEMDMPIFREIRIKAESELRKTTEKPNGEINIYDIYYLLKLRYGIDNVKWASREIELEKALCYANPYAKEIYDILIKNGKTVIAVSDMYIPTNKIKEILDKCGFNKICKIYVSCDCGCNKRDGALQRIATKEFGAEKKYIHVGDNYLGDIRGSKTCGWDTYYYENINKRGNQYRSKYAKTLVRSIHGGIVNAKLHAFNQCDNIYYEHAFVNGGILLCGYCEWLNKLAKNEQIDKFIFVARDGNIISKVYNHFYKKIDSDYFLASRISLLQADFENSIADFIKDIVRSRISHVSGKRTIQQVLCESDLSFLSDKIIEYSLKPDDWFDQNSFEKIEIMIYNYKELITEKFRENKIAVIQYLKGLVEGYKKICIVDVGWNGTSFRIISNLISSFKHDSIIVGALLATSRNNEVQILEEEEKLFSYLYSPLHNWDLIRAHKPGIHTLIIEFLFSAPTPSLYKYVIDKKTGDTKFLFSDVVEKNYEITREMQRGIIDFVKTYNSVISKIGIKLNICPYDAFGQLKQVIDNYKYNLTLFQDYSENGLAGIYDNDTKFGNLMNSRN